LREKADNEENQIFTPDLPRLSDSERGQSYAFCTLPIDGFWIPALEIRNLRESTERGDSYALIDAKGNVLLFERFTLILSNPMDLSGFPFEQQKLRLQLEPLFSSDKEILLFSCVTGCDEACQSEGA